MQLCAGSSGEDGRGEDKFGDFGHVMKGTVISQPNIVIKLGPSLLAHLAFWPVICLGLQFALSIVHEDFQIHVVY